MYNYYNLVVGEKTLVPIADGRKVRYVNLDNAATTPAFKNVVEDLIAFLPYYSSIHRGMGYKSQISTKFYENGRKAVAKFVGADLNNSSIIFIKNATEGINKLANMLYSKYKDDVILSTEMEHHSNDLPWRKFKVEYVKVDSHGRLCLDHLEESLKKHEGKVRLVAVTGASNVTGYKNQIHTIAKIAHSYGAKILVDGAQLVPHAPVDIKPFNSPEHIDYLVFSAHKMYAPFGIGVLIGPKDELGDLPPDYSGGGTVDVVTHDYVKWLDTPEKDESGSPNVLGVVALTSAIKTLKNLNMKNIEDYENKLLKYTLSRMERVPQVKLYCRNCNENVSIITFNVEGIYHEVVSKILSNEFGIGVRSGCFCAHPYVQKLLNISPEEVIRISREHENKPGMVRVSFGVYNNFNEIDYFIYALNNIVKKKSFYLKKYGK
ncbi:aminotransferase class V-fold PLP-dependent enzyme [Clostridium sp. MSJ-11]|uniref:Aminotransferase class V-fold PLP-dependent enzyme n=1 Tax=Clostridium mobile TaxID=2841512 RepID=A0ABS6EDV9_9CLOT|nr:aminotransferase class V-fold PLP-dependent enzyme [Clostridium mobile]MBU5482876.1 aminotransferase class V-fold PLP-dependent enzyme [Clostridium mobile]